MTATAVADWCTVEVLRQRAGRDGGAGCSRELADLVGAHTLLQVDRNGVADIRADLVHGRAARAVEHVQAVERGLLRDLRDFRDLLLHFVVKCGAIRGAVRTVGRFDGQGTNALQVVTIVFRAPAVVWASEMASLAFRTA